MPIRARLPSLVPWNIWDTNYPDAWDISAKVIGNNSKLMSHTSEPLAFSEDTHGSAAILEEGHGCSM